MAEIPDADVWIRRFGVVATPLIFAAVIGIPYVCDRAYRRWLKANDPFAVLWDSFGRARTGYQVKRDNMTEVAQAISDVLAEVERARSSGSGR